MQKFWTVIGFFASATPVGILLGVVLSSVANSDAAASVSALASGRPLSAVAILRQCVSVRLLDDTLLGYYIRIDVDHHWVCVLVQKVVCHATQAHSCMWRSWRSSPGSWQCPATDQRSLAC